MLLDRQRPGGASNRLHLTVGYPWSKYGILLYTNLNIDFKIFLARGGEHLFQRTKF
jgi:hypothetical protein